LENFGIVSLPAFVPGGWDTSLNILFFDVLKWKFEKTKISWPLSVLKNREKPHEKPYEKQTIEIATRPDAVRRTLQCAVTLQPKRAAAGGGTRR
jgi:hypothetical protein